ncbi:MAG: hypothetical protein DHS20C05_21690 [Hyphococcus sp.]|nr:MAG: hypothetical protein DHS20C05_21690 [Marinicaulis sp.]
MGWKLAIAVMSLNGRSLKGAVSDFYGKKCVLSPSDQTVETVLYPSNQNLKFACEEGGNAWVFDWPSVEKALEKRYSSTDDVSFFILHSVVNLYGFSHYRNGLEIRRRVGSSDEGIIFDTGEISENELTALKQVTGDAPIEKTLSSWNNPNELYESDEEEFSHDSLGEEVVFKLIQAQTGINLSRVSERTERFLEMPVTKVKNAGLLDHILGG